MLVPKNNTDLLSYISQIVKNMTDADFAESIRQQIWDNQTFSDYKHYGDFYHNSSHQGTSHLSVIAENGDAVSATTTINLLWVPDVVGFRKFSWGSGVGKDRDMHVLVAWPLILICPINEAGYGGDSILLRFAPPPFLSWEFPLELRWKISLQKELSSLLTPNSQLWVEISFNSYRHHL